MQNRVQPSKPYLRVVAAARKVRANQDGFTALEFAVVFLIFIAISTIAFSTIATEHRKAQDGEAILALKTARAAMESFYLDGQTYYGATAAELRKIDPSIPPQTPNPLASANAYELTFTSKSKVLFRLARDTNGAIAQTCQLPPGGKSGTSCKATKDGWGVW